MWNWLIPLIAGIVIAIIVIFIAYKVSFKKEKINANIFITVGLTLTGIGIFIIANLNRILTFLGIKIPIDTDPIEPESLKEIIAKEREKIRKEKEDALNKKTPDDIINNDLPADARDGVLSAIDDGKNRIDDLFNRARMADLANRNKENSGRDGKTGSQGGDSSPTG